MAQVEDDAVHLLLAEFAEQAGNVSIQGVAPLTHNGFKVNLMKNLVKRSIRDEPMNA